MRQRVLAVAGDCAFVITDRLGNPSAVEQKISQVGERGCVVDHLGQCGFEVRTGGLGQLQSHARNPALVEQKGPLGRRASTALEQRVQLSNRTREVAPVERLERASKLVSVPEHFERCSRSTF